MTSEMTGITTTRRNLLWRTMAVTAGGSLATMSAFPGVSLADVDVDDFMRSGGVSQPMGVSGQAGKGRPETGVVLREGSEVSRDSRTGNVLAEILLGPSNSPLPFLASFSSPWPLAKGSVFDVECRDSKTGDGAFLSVSRPLPPSQTVTSLPSSFFTDELFRPTGRFSFYGAPTSVKVRTDSSTAAAATDVTDGYRYIEISFSNLSQSTQTEIPRRAIVAATVPAGSDEVVMLVASSTDVRWRKGMEGDLRKTAMSFRAVPAPLGGLKIRAKERNA